MPTLHTAPSQTQLLLPVLDSLAARGGQAKTTELYAAVADRTRVSATDRDATASCGASGQRINLFARSVRWAQQRGKFLGLMQPVDSGIWAITAKGRKELRASQPGVVITIFTTEHGVALWAAAEDAVGYLDDGSVQLLLTSPPYPLLREKAYGNVAAQEYVDWFLRLAERWPQKLTDSGSIVLNVGDVWEPGRPTLSLYQERLLIALVNQLGLRLCQRFQWLNPSKMPAPAEWVTVRRVRVKPALETVWWLSPHDHPYADNRQVLVPYSDAMKARLAQGGETGADRPSGYRLDQGAFGTDNGGAIAPNLITAANTDSASGYLAKCRDTGLPIHPARFPAALPEFFVKLCTQPGNTVYDPFGGSSTLGEVAERLGRRWITSDRILAYVLGAQHRFPGAATVLPATV